MHYRVLSGDVELEDDAGNAIPVAAGRQRALIAALVARAGRVVSSDELVDLLWGDDPPDRPANALQVLVSRFRASVRRHGIEPDDLATRGEGYVLDPPESHIDAGRFELAVAEAPSATAEDRVNLLRDALDLWHGRAYGVHADTDVARLEALRLEEMRRGAQVDLGAALVAAGRPDAALAVLEPFVAVHPFHERARAELMRALYAEGRHADALRTYREHQTALAEELGLEPSAPLRKLELDILRHEVSDEAPPRPRDASDALTSMTIRHAATERGPIAWATVGTGPRVAVVPAWVTSLDVIAAGRDPRSALIERLSGLAEVVLYDRLGTGLSRGTVDDYSVDASRVELERILEASGGAATVLAMSQAGPTAVALAAARPDLVERLILFGTFASGPATFPDQALTAALLDVVRSHWGVGSRLFAGLYRPDASDAASEYLSRILQDSAPREVAAGYLETVYTTDVSANLAGIRCPTLVIHYRGDRVVPFSGGRHLATEIPGAELLVLDGPYHLPYADDLSAITTAIAAFLDR